MVSLCHTDCIFPQYLKTPQFTDGTPPQYWTPSNKLIVSPNSSYWSSFTLLQRRSPGCFSVIIWYEMFLSKFFNPKNIFTLISCCNMKNGRFHTVTSRLCQLFKNKYPIRRDTLQFSANEGHWALLKVLRNRQHQKFVTSFVSYNISHQSLLISDNQSHSFLSFL